MRGRWSLWLLAALVVTVPFAVTSTAAASPGAENASTSVTTDPGGTVSAERWETVTLTVRANATNVTGYQSALSYDPTVLQVKSLSGTEDFDDPVATVDNTNGSVVFNQIRSGEVSNPALVELSVQVIGTGGQRSDVSVLTRETRFSDATGATFDPGSSTGATIAVRPRADSTAQADGPDRSGLEVGGPALLLAVAAAVGLLLLRRRRRS